MNEVEIKKNDVIKQLYFILSLVQKSDGPMHSRVSWKKDFMGGIIDRFINTLPEHIIFEKMLFPKIKTTSEIKIIKDYYTYDPSVAKIAPDLLGIKHKEKIIPFAIYNEGWEPVENCPQVEIKTFKKQQYMLSLVNQGYDDKYLILVEFNFKVDYLINYINERIFNDDIYNEIIEELKSYNKELIISDSDELLQPISKINFGDNVLGKMKIIFITKAKHFIDKANFADKGVSPELIKSIEIKKQQVGATVQKMSEYCNQLEDNYFRFNSNWYKMCDNKNKKIREITDTITLDFYCDDIEAIEITKIHKSSLHIYISRKIIFDNETYEKGHYIMSFIKPFDRTNSSNAEYFMNKNLYTRIKNCEEDLLNEISRQIDNN